ncbi:MAG TPA: hypothetical protein VIH21_05335 [Dehalococcoidia bacterium]
MASQIGDRGDLPSYDPIDLAARYGLTPQRVPDNKPFAGEANVGDARAFTVARISGGAIAGNVPPVLADVRATLLAKTQHAYFYAEDGLEVDRGALDAAARDFEAVTWPRVTGKFGEPPTPGVDGDPRIIVLQADLGGAVGGYHSGDDIYPREVRPPSNEAEMIYIDRSLPAGGASFDAVIAHELQHLIHERNDRDEEAWVNEGLSEVAFGLVAGSISTVSSFTARPETQLNRWETTGSLPHYGASAAFFTYLDGRFGDNAAGRVAMEPGDGIAGVSEFLASMAGVPVFRDIFADWIAANILNRSAGPYGNPGTRVEASVESSLSVGDTVDGDATQFGTDYYSLDGLGVGDYTVQFSGQNEVAVLPVESPDDGFYWSNSGDGIDTTLTSSEIDLTSLPDAALTFRTWYDIERWYDWGYVSLSADGGTTWRTLPGEQTSTDNPVRMAYGPGYTGKSGGAEPEWVDERIDLSAYAGQKILLRFEYATDGATHGEGWIIDDVSIHGVASQPSWQPRGWVNVDGKLPQTYVVRIIGERADGEAVVLDVPLDAAQAGVLRFDATRLRNAVLAVAGTTEGTNQRSPYNVTLERP